MRMWSTPAIEEPAAYYIETPYGLVGVSRYQSGDGLKTHAFVAPKLPRAAREMEH